MYTHPEIGDDPWGDDLLTGLTEFDDRITTLETTGGPTGPAGATGPVGPTGATGPAGSVPDHTVPFGPLVRFVGTAADFETAFPPATWMDCIMIYYADAGDKPNIVMSNGVHWVTPNTGYWQYVSTIT